MRTYSTLIPFVALAFTFAANAVPTLYSSSGNTYNSKASVRELDSDVVEARGFVVDDNSLVERSSVLNTEGPPSPTPTRSNVQSSLERRVRQNLVIGAGAVAVGALAIGGGFLAKKLTIDHAKKLEESSSTSSAPDPTPTDSGDECTKYDRREGKC